MCRGLRLAHTWLCRDERGGSLPDEVGSSPQDNSRKGRWMLRANLVLALLGSEREMSRNTHTSSPSN
jgi:hypothetical protein